MRIKKEIASPKIGSPPPPKAQTIDAPKKAGQPAIFDQKPAAKASTTGAHRVLQTKKVGELATTKVDWKSPLQVFDRLGGDGSASVAAGLVGLGKQGFSEGVGHLIDQGVKLLGSAGGDVKSRLEESLDSLGVLKGQKPDSLNMLDMAKLQTAAGALRDAGATRVPGLDTLSIGAQGDEVRSLQGLLNHAMPGVALPIDGKLGSLSRDAIKVFQGQNGLEPTGAMNAGTAQALDRVATHFVDQMPFGRGPYTPDPALDPVRNGETTLEMGQTNDAVAALHRTLNAALPGALGLPPNSSFTDMTQSAVNLFQNASGLPVNGEVTRPVTQFLDNAAGKSNFDKRKAEAAVRGNPAREKAVSIDDIKKDPDAFLKNVTQIDGIDKSDADVSSCGPTALLMGMIAGRPDSVVELGKKLMDDKGNLTPEGKKLLKDGDSPLMKQALQNIRDGKFSPRDITFLGESMRGALGNPTGGVNGNDLMALRSAITGLGVSVPRMELQQFGPPDGGMGHWRVAINDKQYNPWPNAKGQSEVRTGASSLADGAAGWPGGQLREKIYIDDKTVARNVYSVTTTKGKNFTTNQDPPLFVVTYRRDDDGTLQRTGIDKRGIDQKYGTTDQNDVDSVSPMRIPPR